MNPQGHGQPGGREQRPWPGATRTGIRHRLISRRRSRRRRSPDLSSRRPVSAGTAGLPHTPAVRITATPAGCTARLLGAAALPEPPSTSWIQQLQQRQWWIAGGVVVIAAALVAYVMLTGDTSTNEDTATSPRPASRRSRQARPPRFRPSPAPRPPPPTRRPLRDAGTSTTTGAHRTDTCSRCACPTAAAGRRDRQATQYRRRSPRGPGGKPAPRR